MKINKKHLEVIKNFERGYITEDEALLYIFLLEGKIKRKEFDMWLHKLNNKNNKIGHPKYIEFQEKYKTLIDYYNNGNCTLQQMIDAIEILEKINCKQL